MKQSLRRRIALALALAVACVAAYDPSRSENTSGDTISARFWPVALIRHGTWKLNPLRAELEGVAYAAFTVFPSQDLLPRVGWGMALFTVPVYALADMTGLGGREWTPERVNAVSRWNAIFLATASVLALFLLLCRLVAVDVAAASAALFAFGTWNWSMGAQGLYSQGAAVLCHVLNLHLLWNLASGKSDAARKAALHMGVLHVLIWSLRPQDILLVAPAALLVRERKALGVYAAAFLAPLFLLMNVYHAAYGHPLGAYGLLETLEGQRSFRWEGHLGFLGLLFSPNRGALVFFPLLLWVPYLWKKLMPPLRGGRATLRSGPLSGFGRVTAFGAGAYFVFLCFIIYWHGSWGFGPRYLYDLLPYVWVPVTLAVAQLAVRPRARALPAWALVGLALAAAQSVGVHALGHRNYDLYVWNHAMTPIDDAAAWSFREPMVAHVWRAGSNAARWPDGAAARLKRLGF